MFKKVTLIRVLRPFLIIIHLNYFVSFKKMYFILKNCISVRMVKPMWCLVTFTLECQQVDSAVNMFMGNIILNFELTTNVLR